MDRVPLVQVYLLSLLFFPVNYHYTNATFTSVISDWCHRLHWQWT